MTVQELIQLLEGEDPEAEVRYMAQPSWPFEYSIDRDLWRPTGQSGDCDECGYPVHVVDDEHHHIDAAGDAPGTLDADHEPVTDSWADGSFTPTDAPEAGVVYLVEGTQLAYGTKDAWAR